MKEQIFQQKLVEERGSRHEANRCLRNHLSAKEREIDQLKHNVQVAVKEAKKYQSMIDSMRLMEEPTSKEISDLREWRGEAQGVMEQQRNDLNKLKREIISINRKCDEKQQTITNKDNEISSLRSKYEESQKIQSNLTESMQRNSGIMEVQNNRLEKMKNMISSLSSQCEEGQKRITNQEAEISFLHDKHWEHKQLQSEMQATNDNLSKQLDTEVYEATIRIEKKLSATIKDRDLLMMGAQSKPDVTSRSIAENIQMTQQINELMLWKEDALRRGVLLAQKMEHLENDLKRYRMKYQKSKKALADMEKVLMAVETHYNVNAVAALI